MRKIRMTQRRLMIDAARRRTEAKVVQEILPVMQKQKRRLELFLRKATLRKRLNKIQVPQFPDVIISTPGLLVQSNVDKNPATASTNYKVYELLKQDGIFPPVPTPPTQPPAPQSDTNEWNNWKTALVAALILGLSSGVDDIGDAENEVWTSRGYDPLTYDPQQIIDDYQRRTGRNLGEIADNTFTNLTQIISEWYMSGDPFQDLLDQTDNMFGATRANRIAQEESGDVASQIAIQLFGSYGFSQWIWDAIMDDRTCAFCTDQHGKVFKLGDPIPPDAAHNGCRCGATPVIPQETQGQ